MPVYLFSEPSLVNAQNINSLTLIQQEQFMISSQNAWGNFHLQDYPFLISDYEQMSWIYYSIKDDQGSPVYDAWILGDDSGSFFLAGSTSEAPVEMIQSHITELEEDGASLAEELSLAYENAPKAFERNGEYDGEAFDSYWKSYYSYLAAQPIVLKGNWDQQNTIYTVTASKLFAHYTKVFSFSRDQPETKHALALALFGNTQISSLSLDKNTATLHGITSSELAVCDELMKTYLSKK